MDGIIRALWQRSRTLSLGIVKKVHLLGNTLEIELTLSPGGEDVIAEVAEAAAGDGGAIIRKPKKNDVAVVALIDGDLNNAVIIGWLHHGNSQNPSEITSGTHVVAPKEEKLELRSDKTSVELKADGTVSIKGGNGKKSEILIDNSGRLKIESDSKELLQQVISLAEEVNKLAAQVNKLALAIPLCTVAALPSPPGGPPPLPLIPPLNIPDIAIAAGKISAESTKIQTTVQTMKS